MKCSTVFCGLETEWDLKLQRFDSTDLVLKHTDLWTPEELCNVGGKVWEAEAPSLPILQEISQIYFTFEISSCSPTFGEQSPAFMAIV